MTTPYGQPPQYGESGDPYGQPQYGQSGQPPYGGLQYGQPPHYSATANAYGDPIGSGAKFGVVGATLAGVGFILLIISFTALDWVKGGVSFSDLNNAADRLDVPGLTKSYFSYLGWLLAILLVVVAIVACLPSPVSGPLRAFGAVLAAAAIALTLFALKGNGSFGDVFSDARAGFYVALLGFLVAGIGSLVGPQHRR